MNTRTEATAEVLTILILQLQLFKSDYTNTIVVAVEKQWGNKAVQATISVLKIVAASTAAKKLLYAACSKTNMIIYLYSTLAVVISVKELAIASVTYITRQYRNSTSQ